MNETHLLQELFALLLRSRGYYLGLAFLSSVAQTGLPSEPVNPEPEVIIEETIVPSVEESIEEIVESSEEVPIEEPSEEISEEISEESSEEIPEEIPEEIGKDYYDVTLRDYVTMSGRTVQGMDIARIDGDDLLCVSISGQKGPEDAGLVIYDLNREEVVAYKDNISIGHGNGVSYCSKDGYFYIACSGGVNGLTQVLAFDRYLECTRSIVFDNTVRPYAIAYDEERDQFVMGIAGKKFAVCDYDFNILTTTKLLVPEEKYRTQNIGIKNDKLFLIYNLLEKDVSEIHYYSYDGTNIAFSEIQKIDMPGELESMTYYRRRRYMMFAKSGGFELFVYPDNQTSQ